jgi:F-box protein 21
MLEECISKLNEQIAEIAAAVRFYLEFAKFSLSLLFCLFQKTVHHRPSSLKFSVGLVAICNYKTCRRNIRKPCVIVSWNLKFQESNEWKSKATREDDCYSSDEEDSDEEDSDEEDEESQDQPHYHILMVDSDEDNPQFQLNVPEGNQLCVSGPLRINIK